MRLTGAGVGACGSAEGMAGGGADIVLPPPEKRLAARPCRFLDGLWCRCRDGGGLSIYKPFVIWGLGGAAAWPSPRQCASAHTITTAAGSVAHNHPIQRGGEVPPQTGSALARAAGARKRFQCGAVWPSCGQRQFHRQSSSLAKSRRKAKAQGGAITR